MLKKIEVKRDLRTYIKVEGENKEDIVRKLARLAVDSPRICVMDINILDELMPGNVAFEDDPRMLDDNWSRDYFGLNDDAPQEQCSRLISKSGADLGDADIYFEWLDPPNEKQKSVLKRKIESILKPSGYKYSIIEKN